MLSCAYMFPDLPTLRLPDRFGARTIYILTRHGHSYFSPALQKSILEPKASAFLQSSGLQPSLTWIERYGDERIGCTETIAVRERF